MESHVIRCVNCNDVIAVQTDNGFIVGNIIVEELDGKCSCNDVGIELKKGWDGVNNFNGDLVNVYDMSLVLGED